MQELIERIGLPLLIQVVIETWNGLFLLIMMSSLVIGSRGRRQNAAEYVKVPFTREILIFYNLIFLYNFLNVVYIIFDGAAGVAAFWIVRISNFLYFVIGAFLSLFYLELLKKHVAEENGAVLLKKITFALQLLHIPLLILLTLTPFTGALYYFNAQNQYVRGKYFFLWHGSTILVFIFILAVLVMYRNKMHRFLRQIITTATIIPICGFILNTNYTGISFNNICVSLAALIIFMFYEKHRTDVTVQRAHELDQVRAELAEKQLALEQSKNEVLVAQIQPHFINNALMAIRSRCREYPDLYRCITNFSKYLRSHFDAISNTKMITFEQEMENVEAYLDLERDNYGDRLQVEYDIECDQFLVPALSVQPLVENAVRHGIGTYEEGGVVHINARRQDEKICIEIIDDGSGQSNITQQQEKRKGIGIENVRARLRAYCQAELEMISSEHGTIARITMDDEQGGAI